MAQAANAENRDGVAGAGAGVAQRVEGGDARAQQRGGVGVGKFSEHEGDGIGGGNDVVGVAAVEVDAAHERAFAEHEVAAAAGRAVVAVASVPAEADALAGLEERDVGADGVDDSGDLVAGHARKLEAGPQAFLGQRVRVAHPAGMDADADMAGAGIGEFFFDELKRTAGGGYLHGTAFYWHREVFS